MTKVLVLYYSAWGHMEQMSYAAAEGAREAGATVDVKRVPELVPLSCLVNHLGGWLQDCQTPLVFICRSGGRSARTAACLRRLGHPNAWHLAGGLANSLAPPAAVLGNKETADEPAFT